MELYRKKIVETLNKNAKVLNNIIKECRNNDYKINNEQLMALANIAESEEDILLDLNKSKNDF